MTIVLKPINEMSGIVCFQLLRSSKITRLSLIVSGISFSSIFCNQVIVDTSSFIKSSFLEINCSDSYVKFCRI